MYYSVHGFVVATVHSIFEKLSLVQPLARYAATRRSPQPTNLSRLASRHDWNFETIALHPSYPQQNWAYFVLILAVYRTSRLHNTKNWCTLHWPHLTLCTTNAENSIQTQSTKLSALTDQRAMSVATSSRPLRETSFQAPPSDHNDKISCKRQNSRASEHL
jgi:hypothetical protein